MPGDLRNPEFLFPFHYDNRYEPGTNPFDARPVNLEQILQGISRSERGGLSLTNHEMLHLKDYLNAKNLLNRNPCDQEIQDATREFFKLQPMARKVAMMYARSK
jgi:hypothetical protein